MRILHVLDHSVPLHSGYAFRTLAILREQQALGWETCQLTGPKQGGGRDDAEDAEGLHFFRTASAHSFPARIAEHVPLASHWQVVQTLAKRLEPLVRELRPDILHAHSPALNGLAALRVARKHGLPLVYEVRAFWEDAAVDHGTSVQGGPRYRLTRALETHVLRRADHVTTICEGLRSDIVARGIPADKVTIIPNAVHPQRFPFGRARDERIAGQLGLTGKSVLGFAGSFYTYEGLDLLVAAMPTILRKRPDVHLLLVGGGPQEAALIEQVQQLQLDAHVHFTGRVSHAEIGRYYSIIDWLVYPRRSKRITDLVTPLKPLEAMALGKPVIASDVGGHRELISDGQTGLLFTADSVTSLADKALVALNDLEIGETLKRRGRQFVEQQRTWERSVGLYRGVYNKVARQKASDSVTSHAP